jgi:epoxyqueuosine reductase
LQQWLNEGHHGEMDYMAKHGTRRTTQPVELARGTLRGISVRMNYMPAAKASWQVIRNGNKAFLSRYALGRDYQGIAGAIAKTCG